MQYPKGPDSSDCGTTLSRSRSRSRGTSISSDSQFSRLNIFSPPSVDPLPSFIAPSSASQIVTTDQEFNTADFVPDEDSDSGALVTPDALSALNGFLDHLLFNILAAAKSTQLALIRPAVAEVLKPRLAKELVSLADEELSEYLGGPEDEQADFGGGQSPDGEFDLIRTWKLTRLRCMVYTRLGDLEEDDEEEYIAQQGLADDEGASRRFGHRVGNITPPTAIFLTSIVEHIGEQALVIAGETARSRLSSKFLECDDNQDGVKERGRLNRLVVEELDVEKLALNPTLGRLWRTWRKRTRTPQLSRMASRDSIMRRGTIGHLPHSRKSSFSVAEDAQSQTTPLIEAPAEVDPASIPLPINENDVQEIDRDVPQDVESGEIQTMQAVVAHKVRPHSLMVLNLLPPKTPSPQGGSPATPDPHTPVTPVTLHARSRSLPSPTSPPDQEVPEEPAQTARKPSSTASEERRRLETMYEQEERDETERVEENEVERTVSKTESPPERRIDEMPTSALPVAVHASSSEPNAKSPRTPVQEVRPSLDSLRDKASNSGDSATSTYSRPYHRPAPLVVSSGSQRSATSVSTSGTERAAVQRISAQPASARSSPHTTTHADPRRSDSFSSQREKRPVTAGSAASQVSSKLKGLITKPSEPAPLRLRSSSESSRTRGATEDSYDDTRGLDELIRSEETLHYTLTPRSVREMDFPDTSKLKGPTSELADFLKSTGPEDTNWSKPKASPASLRGLPLPKSPKSPKSLKFRTPDSPKPSPTQALPIQAGPMNPVQKGKAVQAREARPSMESGHDNPQPIGNSGPNSPATTVHSSAGRRLSDATQPSKRPSRADTSLSHSTRDPRLQARSAAVPKSEATSDLIDFIREGPPTVGARRIPRTVAPFRTTMDSEDLAYEQGNPSAPSVSSTQGESTATKSEVSVGSRTGLLDSASIKTTQTASSRLHSNSSKMAAGDGTALKRTQRRVPDPYATDWDDEELEAVLKDEKLRGAESSSGKMTVEDGSRPTPTERHVPDPYATDWDDEELEAVLEDGKPQREVESLVDFLRNVPPPAAEPQPKSFAPKSVPSKASTDGPGGSTSAMKARFSRNNSSGRVPSVKSSRTSLRMQWDQQSTGSGYTATVNTERRAGGGRSGMPSVSERQTETSALADFLRNTGPPDPPVSRAPPPKEPSFARRFFVRRKKVEA